MSSQTDVNGRSSVPSCPLNSPARAIELHAQTRVVLDLDAFWCLYMSAALSMLSEMQYACFSWYTTSRNMRIKQDAKLFVIRGLQEDCFVKQLVQITPEKT